MNRSFLLLAAALLAGAIPVFAQDGAAAPADAVAQSAPEASTAKLESEMDKMSYIIGLQMGKSVAGSGLDISLGALSAGIDDAMNNRKPALSDEDMMQVSEKLRNDLQAKRAEMVQKEQEKQKVEADANIKIADEFVANNSKQPGVVTTESGLQYQVMQEGDAAGVSPKDGDSVTVHYKGTLLDGTEFDSSYKRNEPATFKVGQLIPGWNEALTLMKKGAKMKLFIHPKLGYKDRNMGEIPPNSLLVFEMELLEVVPADPNVKEGTMPLPGGDAVGSQ